MHIHTTIYKENVATFSQTSVVATSTLLTLAICSVIIIAITIVLTGIKERKRRKLKRGKNPQRRSHMVTSGAVTQSGMTIYADTRPQFICGGALPPIDAGNEDFNIIFPANEEDIRALLETGQTDDGVRSGSISAPESEKLKTVVDCDSKMTSEQQDTTKVKSKDSTPSDSIEPEGRGSLTHQNGNNNVGAQSHNLTESSKKEVTKSSSAVLSGIAVTGSSDDKVVKIEDPNQNDYQNKNNIAAETQESATCN